jgi:glycosyltransferase involved in cell wall biosynthesis
MRVGINLLPYTAESHGGAEVYLRSISNALSKKLEGHRIFIIGTREVVNSACRANTVLEPIMVPRVLNGSRLERIILEQTLLPILCSMYKLDCIVSNYVSPIIAPCPKVTVIHDTIFKRYPETLERLKLLYWRLMIPFSILCSAAIATVSHFSAEEIATFYPRAKPRLFVTVEGVRPSLMAVKIGGNNEVHDYSVPYLLCVTSYGKHKNLDSMMRALATLPKEAYDVRLVLVGAARTLDAIKYRAGLEALIDELGLAKRVEFANYVSDEELAGLYRNALGLILPSLYEGFGLPVIEAHRFGCPVLCSNMASLPEIAGDGALLFDPTSVESIAQAVMTLLDSRTLRQQLAENGYKNAERFSWEKAASELKAAIDFTVKSCREPK